MSIQTNHSVTVLCEYTDKAYNLSLLVFQVTCMTVHENMNYMAIGFENGAVLLFKGDVTKER